MTAVFWEKISPHKRSQRSFETLTEFRGGKLFTTLLMRTSAASTRKCPTSSVDDHEVTNWYPGEISWISFTSLYKVKDVDLVT